MIIDEKSKQLIREYLHIKAELKKRGIIRSDKDIVGDLGETLAVEHFHLTPAPTSVQKTHDATEGEITYQIKTRLVKSVNQSTSFDFRHDDEFDFLVIVLLDKNTGEPLQDPKKIPWEIVKKNWVKNKENFSFRWNKKTRLLVKDL